MSVGEINEADRVICVRESKRGSDFHYNAGGTAEKICLFRPVRQICRAGRFLFLIYKLEENFYENYFKLERERI